MKKLDNVVSMSGMKDYIKRFFPNVDWYNKNHYYYIVPYKESGDTLGSGDTLEKAWTMAFENTYDTYTKEK